jgi:hypothetical protein
MVGFSFVAKGTGNRDAIRLPRSLDSKLPSILIASRFPLGGNLAAMARELFVENTATDVVCLEGLKVHCRTLVDDLAGRDPSPVLRLAVEMA